jgi:hypothetical protein
MPRQTAFDLSWGFAETLALQKTRKPTTVFEYHIRNTPCQLFELMHGGRSREEMNRIQIQHSRYFISLNRLRTSHRKDACIVRITRCQLFQAAQAGRSTHLLDNFQTPIRGDLKSSKGFRISDSHDSYQIGTITCPLFRCRNSDRAKGEAWSKDVFPKRRKLTAALKGQDRQTRTTLERQRSGTNAPESGSTRAPGHLQIDR